MGAKHFDIGDDFAAVAEAMHAQSRQMPHSNDCMHSFSQIVQLENSQMICMNSLVLLFGGSLFVLFKAFFKVGAKGLFPF